MHEADDEDRKSEKWHRECGQFPKIKEPVQTKRSTLETLIQKHTHPRVFLA